MRGDARLRRRADVLRRRGADGPARRGARHRPDRAAAAERARARRRPADGSGDRGLAARSPRRSALPRRSRCPAAEALPRDPIRLPGGAGNTTRGEGVQRGVGFAVGFKNICYSEGFDDSCAARVVLHADGSAEVHCAAAEVGQGVVGVILQVARTELGTDDVTLAPHTTATVGSAGSASASRMTWMAAGAVQDACRAALEERERTGGVRGRRRARATGIRGRRRSIPRRARSPGERAHVALAVLGDARRRRGRRRARPHARRLDRDRAGRRPGRQPARASRARSRAAPRRGSASRVMEEIQTRDGRITNASFTDYLIPTTLDMPPVESVLIEVPEPTRPTAPRASASRRRSSRPRPSSRRCAPRPAGR